MPPSRGGLPVLLRTSLPAHHPLMSDSLTLTITKSNLSLFCQSPFPKTKTEAQDAGYTKPPLFPSVLQQMFSFFVREGMGRTGGAHCSLPEPSATRNGSAELQPRCGRCVTGLTGKR